MTKPFCLQDLTASRALLSWSSGTNSFSIAATNLFYVVGASLDIRKVYQQIADMLVSWVIANEIWLAAVRTTLPMATLTRLEYCSNLQKHVLPTRKSWFPQENSGLFSFKRIDTVGFSGSIWVLCYHCKR